MLGVRPDLDPHEHVASQGAVRVRHDDANLHRLRAGVSERRDVVHAPGHRAPRIVRDYVHRLANRHVGQIVGIDVRQHPHGREIGDRVAWRGSSGEQLTLRDELLDDRAVDRRAHHRRDGRLLPVAHRLDLVLVNAEGTHSLDRRADVGVRRRDVGLRLLQLRARERVVLEERRILHVDPLRVAERRLGLAIRGHRRREVRRRHVREHVTLVHELSWFGDHVDRGTGDGRQHLRRVVAVERDVARRVDGWAKRHRLHRDEVDPLTLLGGDGQVARLGTERRVAQLTARRVVRGARGGESAGEQASGNESAGESSIHRMTAP